VATECHRLKILVVDDETDTRIFLCNLLGNCGYEAIDAEDGEEGYEKAKAEQPDLIILDIMMSGEKGIHMYRSLKLDDGLKTVPLIVVSSIGRKAFAVYRKSHNLWEDPAKPRREAFLEKPLEADELMQAVRDLTQPGAVSAG
jgi:twitching motility two-component system response regulator PilH